jgi:glutathione synthase/RimK-type ligase-like ATP-grasp enzyme
MILILTDKFDVHADAIIKKLIEERIDYFRMNLDVESLMKTHVSFENFVWEIKTEMGEIFSNNISCVWCRRPFVELTLQEQGNSEIDFKIWKNEWNKTLLGLYNSLKDLEWLNPLRKAYKGENKYYQMDVARKVGFKFPETLISNNKTKITQFASEYDKVLFKLMSQEIYDLGDENFKGLFTNVVTKNELEDFTEYGENPIVLQRYIDKEFEVRYTVVGDEHLVCKIDSQCSAKAKYDWRHYDIANTPHFSMEAPDDIKHKVTLMLSELELEYGALDFIVTPENEWYFLEINCMGQWLWIEQLTNLSISDAIVKWIKKNIREVS